MVCIILSCLHVNINYDVLVLMKVYHLSFYRCTRICCCLYSDFLLKVEEVKEILNFRYSGDPDELERMKVIMEYGKYKNYFLAWSAYMQMLDGNFAIAGMHRCIRL